MLKTESTRQCFQEAMKMLTCGMQEEQTQENTKKTCMMVCQQMQERQILLGV